MSLRTYRLPKAVYYQCIWIVKDIERLNRLALAARAGNRENEVLFFEVDDEAVDDRAVLRQARFKLECITRAAELVPYEYRQGIIESIIENLPLKDVAHENTWRKWRKVFIRGLAKELELV